MWWHRHKRKPRPAPRPARPEDLERARSEARRAHIQLENARSQDCEIEERAETMERLRRENNIGPKFWDAVSRRREA